MSSKRIWIANFIGIYILVTNVGAQGSIWNSTGNNPGCYGFCRFISLGTGSQGLCNESASVGYLFLDNFESCADCVRENRGLSWAFNRSDAENIQKLVTACQTLFPGNYTVLASAMPVISKYGGLGTTTTAAGHSTMPATSPSVTMAPTNSSSGSTADESPHPNSRAWIADAVAGPIAGVSLVVIAVFTAIKRVQRRQNINTTIDADDGIGYLYGKSELSAEPRELHELEARDSVETTASIPPQELGSTEIAELRAHEGR